MAACPPPSVGSCSTGQKVVSGVTVQLQISCKGLKRTDLFSKSDPLVAINAPSWGPEVARTELIKNDQNPRFTKAIEMEYRCRERQALRFSVYDIEDEETATLYYDDLLGYVDCDLKEIVQQGTFTKKLTGKDNSNSKDIGSMTINAEEVSKEQHLLEMKFSARGLDKKDLLGKSDPFLEFERQNPDGSFNVVYKTVVIRNTLNPSWPQIDVTSQVLCNGNPDRNIRVRCYDWDSDSSNDLIGEFYTTLAELTDAASESGKHEWEAINPAKQAKKKSYKNSGTVHLEFIKITPVYSFLDYITSGCQINFTMAIDFSSSNCNPTHPSTKSLHYIDPAFDNHYIQVLKAVGSCCQDYDTDKLFPAYGFGAIVGDETQTSHLFALNGILECPHCAGIEGVIDAYKQAFECVQHAEPTCVSPVINHVAKLAAQVAEEPNSQRYQVLIILTDGKLSDVNEMKHALVKASHLPMSVIIVGVGNADMENLRELDKDDGLLSVDGEVAFRDIVQFVPFATGQFYFVSPEDFASAALSEIPKQLTDYMMKKNIKPLGK